MSIIGDLKKLSDACWKAERVYKDADEEFGRLRKAYGKADDAWGKVDDNCIKLSDFFDELPDELIKPVRSMYRVFISKKSPKEHIEAFLQEMSEMYKKYCTNKILRKKAEKDLIAAQEKCDELYEQRKQAKKSCETAETAFDELKERLNKQFYKFVTIKNRRRFAALCEVVQGLQDKKLFYSFANKPKNVGLFYPVSCNVESAFKIGEGESTALEYYFLKWVNKAIAEKDVDILAVFVRACIVKKVCSSQEGAYFLMPFVAPQVFTQLEKLRDHVIARQELEETSQVLRTLISIHDERDLEMRKRTSSKAERRQGRVIAARVQSRYLRDIHEMVVGRLLKPEQLVPLVIREQIMLAAIIREHLTK